MAYQSEIEKLEQRYQENPKQWFAALADAYRKQGEVDLALEYVRSGIEERPNYASAHIVLGRCHLEKEEDDDAARAFEQVLELDAENIIALKSLEEIAERKGDFDRAKDWLTRLLEVDPMNDEARETLERLQQSATAEPDTAGLEETDVPELEVEPAGEEIALDETLPMDSAPDEPAPMEPVGLSDGEDLDIERTSYEGPSEPASLGGEGDIEVVSFEDEIAVAEDDTPADIQSIDLESPMGEMGPISDVGIEEEPPLTGVEPLELDSPLGDAGPWEGEQPTPDSGLMGEDAVGLEPRLDGSDALLDSPIELEQTPSLELESRLDDSESIAEASIELESRRPDDGSGHFGEPTEEAGGLKVEPLDAESSLSETETLSLDESGSETDSSVDMDVAEIVVDAGVPAGDDTVPSSDASESTREVDALELETLREQDELGARITQDSDVSYGMDDGADIPPVADVVELEDVSEVAEEAEAIGAVEIESVPDVGETIDVVDAPDIVEGIDAPEIEDVAEVAGVLGVADTTDSPDSGEAGDVPDVPDITDVPELSDVQGIPDVEEEVGVADALTSAPEDVPRTAVIEAIDLEALRAQDEETARSSVESTVSEEDVSKDAESETDSEGAFFFPESEVETAAPSDEAGTPTEELSAEPDLAVESVDSDLGWGAEDREATAASVDDRTKAEAGHEQLSPAIDFLGDPEGRGYEDAGSDAREDEIEVIAEEETTDVDVAPLEGIVHEGEVLETLSGEDTEGAAVGEMLEVENATVEGLEVDDSYGQYLGGDESETPSTQEAVVDAVTDYEESPVELADGAVESVGLGTPDTDFEEPLVKEEVKEEPSEETTDEVQAVAAADLVGRDEGTDAVDEPEPGRAEVAGFGDDVVPDTVADTMPVEAAVVGEVSIPDGAEVEDIVSGTQFAEALAEEEGDVEAGAELVDAVASEGEALPDTSARGPTPDDMVLTPVPATVDVDAGVPEGEPATDEQVEEDTAVAASSPVVEPEPVVTETMAEVYAKQGLYEQAREIYEVLVMQHADDERLKARLEELNLQANAALQQTRVSRFSVAATGGESVVAFLQQVFSGTAAATVEEDQPAPVETVSEQHARTEDRPESSLETAFREELAESQGAPTVPAPDEVKLETVFDGNPPSPPPKKDSQTEDAVLEQSTDDGVSFDEFYGSEPAEEPPEVADSGNAPLGDDEADDDFKQWLEGLKT